MFAAPAPLTCATEMANAGNELRELLRTSLSDRGCAWSVGAWGALAEYHWVRGDRAAATTRGELTVASERGAVQLVLSQAVRPLAIERPTRSGETWLRELVLTLSTARARMARRRVLTEAGPDGGAVLDEHRGDLLFDLGLGIEHLDAHVRTSDPELVAMLRRHCGQELLTQAPDALGAIKHHSPHRVFCSALCRIEVFQRIGSSAQRVPTPEGPHTHVLPALLAERRRCDPDLPVPKGRVRCATLHLPAHAPSAHPFDRLLSIWGDPAFVATKARVIDSVRCGVAPEDYPRPRRRVERHALRVALRQLAAATPGDEGLSRWRARFDRPSRAGH